MKYFKQILKHYIYWKKNIIKYETSLLYVCYVKQMQLIKKISIFLFDIKIIYSKKPDMIVFKNYYVACSQFQHHCTVFLLWLIGLSDQSWLHFWNAQWVSIHNMEKRYLSRETRQMRESWKFHQHSKLTSCIGAESFLKPTFTFVTISM